MSVFETFRSELVAALTEATRFLGYREADAVRRLPKLTEPEAREEWLWALGGGNGPRGLIDDARDAIQRGGDIARIRAWLRAYDLMVGMREELRTVPAVDSVAVITVQEPLKLSCECISGCSGCDGAGVTFIEPEAA